MLKLVGAMIIISCLLSASRSGGFLIDTNQSFFHRMMVTIMFVGLTIAAAHLVLGLILWLRVRNLYSYPGVLGFPILGNLYYFYKTIFIGSIGGMHTYLVEIADKYGKDGLCFSWIHGYSVAVTASSPQLVKELAFHPDLSSKPEAIYGGFTIYLNGPLSSCRSDDSWKLKRKEYNIFLKRSHVDNNYYNIFTKCANKLVGLMLGSPLAVDAHHKTTVIAQDVTSETLFGMETSLVHHPKVIDLMIKLSSIASFCIGNPKSAKLITTLVRLVDTVYFGKVAEMRKMLLDYASEKLQCPLTEQTLSMQIMARIKKCKKSQKTLENEMHELFVTSSHTVTAALSNSINFLALLTDIQEKAWQEQFEIFGDDDREPTMDDLKQMHFLDRYIKEALRFLAPPFIAKLASRDININGVTIPQGANVILLMRYLRMDSKFWKNPNVFDPDRFLEENDLLKHIYSPFGIGIRNCPGMHFATALMKITLSKILRRLKLKPVDDKFRFEDIRYKYSLMSEVANPPMLRAEERT